METHDKIIKLLSSDWVSEKTRAVITKRLLHPPMEPQFFTSFQFSFLTSIIESILPQKDESFRVDIAGEIDLQISKNLNKGWRFAWSAPIKAMYIDGLNTIDKISLMEKGVKFIELPISEQESIIDDLYKKLEDGERSPLNNFLRELLVNITEVYYSHPLVQLSIGINTWEDKRE